MYTIPGTSYQTQEEIDLQLDVEFHYWHLDPYWDYFISESAKVVEEYKPLQDIRVGPRDEERVDVFKSPKSGSPIVLFIHGGWWTHGHRSWFPMVARGFIERGYTVVMSGYALCPTVGVPDITNASRAAVAWTYENAESINGDRDRIFVVGHSAGGHQAAMMGITDWPAYGLPRDVIKGVAPISGLFDLRPIRYSCIQPKLQFTAEVVQAESPLLQIRDDGPPMFVSLGGHESVEWHSQAQLFVEAWRNAGMQATYLDVPDENHTTNVYRLADKDSQLSVALDAFFKSC